MYLPSHFAETRPAVLHELVAAHPLGTLVTLTDGSLDANLLPFELAPSEGPHGTLRAHVARANPVWRNHAANVEVLVIFQGPATYVTPSWYETKRETGRVVPTYNYCAVLARGPLVVRDDREWLRAQVTRLTARFEAGRAAPWTVSDAPADFLDKQLAAIVGLEIPLSSLTGKWKVSQNRSAADRAGVETGLRAEGTDAAAQMADVVRQFGPPKSV